MHVLRELPRRSAEGPEPVLPGEVARAASELYAHHPDGRGGCDGQLDGDVVPAWADVSALQLAIVVALVGARRLAGPAGDVQLRINSTEEVVRFDARASVGVGDEGQGAVGLDATAAAWLLRESGGRAVAHAFGIVIEVPTLAAVRRARMR